MDENNEQTSVAGESEPVQLLSCDNCQSPVASRLQACPSCGAPLSGRELPYIPRRSTSGPDIFGLFKWWVIWSFAIFALSGFSFGTVSSLLFTGLSMVYLVRILRAYYR